MKEDIYALWEDRISKAKKKRKEWAGQFQVQKGWEYFEGKVNPGFPEAEWINVNKIFAHLQAQLPMLYSIDPYFYVKLKKSYQIDPTEIAKYEKRGTIRQAMLNYLKGELGLKEKARMGILDAHFEYGVLKVRYAADDTPHDKAGEPMLSASGEQMKDEQTGKDMVYPDTVPVNERYEICWVNACDFIFDEDAGPIEDSWGFVAQHFQMTKKAALKDRRFSKKTINSMAGKKKDGDEERKTGITSWFADKFKEKKEEDEMLDIWEVYDLKKKQWLFYGEDADELLKQPEALPKGVEKHPYSVLVFSPRKTSPYPIPPVFNALDPQKEYSLSRSRLLTHRKRFNRKYEVNKNMLADDVELSKLESGEDGAIVLVNAIGAVNPIKDAPLDQQNLQELMLLNNDLVEVFGTPASARGVADADSATEASILDKRLEVREGDKTGMVSEWIITAMTKLDQLVQCHIDKDTAVRVTGPQGEFWEVVRETDYAKVDGEFEYSVNLGASQPRLPQLERAQWIAFMSQVIIPFPHILTSPSIMKRMAEMFGIEDEAAIEEFRILGQKIMSGMMPMPGGQGGGASDNPVAAVMGAALGSQGGTNNGGGSSMVQ